jgi:hypothetical protein
LVEERLRVAIVELSVVMQKPCPRYPQGFRGVFHYARRRQWFCKPRRVTKNVRERSTLRDGFTGTS